MTRELRKKAKEGRWDKRFLNGHPDVRTGLRPTIMRAVAAGLIVTSTTDGVHAPNSFHYSGRAVDFGVEGGFRPWALARLLRFQRREHSRYGRAYSELFGPSNRANRRYGHSFRMTEGTSLESLHDNHVHIAI